VENQGSSSRHTCAFCKKTYLYHGCNDDGSLYCQNCGKIFYPRVSVDLQGERVPTATTWLTTRRIQGVRVKCPHCGATYVYRDEHRIGNDKIQCQNCAASIEASGEDFIIIEETAYEDESTPGDILSICFILVLFFFVPWIISFPLIICLIYGRVGRRYKTRLEKKQGIDIG